MCRYHHRADGSITGNKLRHGSISADHLTADSVSGTELQQSAVGSEHLQPSVVQSVHLAEGSVKSDHLGTQVVSSQHLKPDIIHEEHIAEQVVTSHHLAPSSRARSKPDSPNPRASASFMTLPPWAILLTNVWAGAALANMPVIPQRPSLPRCTDTRKSTGLPS